ALLSLSPDRAAAISEVCQTNLSLAYPSPWGVNPISVLLQFPGCQARRQRSVRSDLENEERRARWRINSANVAPRRISMHSSSTRAELRLRGHEPPYDAGSWPRFARSTRSRKTKLEENSRDKSACSSRRTTSRSIRPTEFNNCRVRVQPLISLLA